MIQDRSMNFLLPVLQEFWADVRLPLMKIHAVMAPFHITTGAKKSSTHKQQNRALSSVTLQITY